MEKSMKCVKYLLFAFNLIFALTGFVLIVTGGVIEGIYSKYLDFLGSEFFNAPILLVVIGCIVFCVSFFGCCGAIKENHCMTMTFSVLLGVIFIVQIGGGIAAYMFRTEAKDIISDNMEKGLGNFGSDGYNGVTKTWNSVQHELECCGVDGYKDWEGTAFSDNGTDVPDSCCLSDISGCGEGILHMNPTMVPKIIYTNGCLDKFEMLIGQNIAIVGAVGIVIALIQFIGIILACVLARTIRHEYEQV